MVRVAHFIPLCPLVGFAANLFFGKSLGKRGALVSIAGCLGAFALSAYTFYAHLHGQTSYTLGTWLFFGPRPLMLGVTVDPLTCLMLLVVTLIGTLIQVYSVGYMGQDPRFTRFFAYLSLFMTSMLGLLLSDNFISLYMFWEGVGLCSYLLISFWFEKTPAANAGMKAFITTRIGDVGLFLGILILFVSGSDLSFSGLGHPAGPSGLYTVAALLIFCGAVGKSAQFPLHVWLPDAMEGPTPVSALVHSATMVAAGVYLVARCFALFSAHGTALIWVAYTGAFTAILAASIATVHHDIKRVLAYSTISQLGLMMTGLGVGGYTAGTFHLMTHAFFKALLFLCAGSIIHGVHTQDIRKMGGLFPHMKITGATFVIASLAIAGVPPLAGFWSKDEILAEVFHTGHPFLFAVVALTSLLTAFYMFRLVFLVLFGKMRSELHPHESPKTMTMPLALLSLFAAFAGLPGSPFFHHAFQRFMALPNAHGHGSALPVPDPAIMGFSVLIAALGVGAAYIVYGLNKKPFPDALAVRLEPLHRLILNKYYFDELYSFLFIRPLKRLSGALFKGDVRIIDGAVNLAARLTVLSSRLKAWFDRTVVDGLVNLTAKVTGLCSDLLRLTQTGHVQTYLLVACFGLILMMAKKLAGGS